MATNFLSAIVTITQGSLRTDIVVVMCKKMAFDLIGTHFTQPLNTSNLLNSRFPQILSQNGGHFQGPKILIRSSTWLVE